jgi:hypothetical protein
MESDYLESDSMETDYLESDYLELNYLSMKFIESSHSARSIGCKLLDVYFKDDVRDFSSTSDICFMGRGKNAISSEMKFKPQMKI